MKNFIEFARVLSSKICQEITFWSRLKVNYIRYDLVKGGEDENDSQAKGEKKSKTSLVKHEVSLNRLRECLGFCLHKEDQLNRI